MDRVTYSQLSPRRADFDMVTELMVRTGVLDHTIAFDDYVDTRFAEHADEHHPWEFRAGDQIAR